MTSINLRVPGIQVSERFRQIQERDRLAQQIADDRQRRRHHVQDRIGRRGKLANLAQHRPEELGDIRAEIQIDVVEIDVRPVLAMLDVPAPVEVEVGQDARELRAAPEAQSGVEIYVGNRPEPRLEDLAEVQAGRRQLRPGQFAVIVRILQVDFKPAAEEAPHVLDVQLEEEQLRAPRQLRNDAEPKEQLGRRVHGRAIDVVGIDVERFGWPL